MMMNQSPIRRYVLIQVISAVLFVFVGFSCEKKDEILYYTRYGNEDLVLKKTYYPNGKVLAEETFLQLQDSLILHGYAKLFYETGESEYFANYNQNRKIGSVIKYYKSGQVKEYWFYNPEGHAIYSIHYSKTGNIVSEIEKDQRKPQIIIKEKPNNHASLKIYSADIPNRYRNLYLISPTGIGIDTIKNCSSLFETFEIIKEEGEYKVEVAYFDNKGYLESDSTRFYLVH